ncbi:unnamed protein product, partial [Laminaria digitata]
LYPLDGRPRNVCLGHFRTRNSDQSICCRARRNRPHGVATGNSRSLVGTTAAFLPTESHVNSNARAGLLRLDNPLCRVEVAGQHAAGLRVPVLYTSPNLPRHNIAFVTHHFGTRPCVWVFPLMGR